MKNSASSDTALLESRALALKALSVGFQYPDSGWKARFENLVQAAAWAEIRIALNESALETLESEHFLLFGPQAACPLELAFHLTDDPFEQAKIMAEMAGFYKAFGVELENGSRPDHVSACLEFTSYLQLKKMNALEKGLHEPLGTTQEALTSFVRDFLKPGVSAFHAKLQGSSHNGFYGKLADIVLKEVAACDV